MVLRSLRPGRIYIHEAAQQLRAASVNWRAIVFWALLWWFIYSAPTEGLLSRALHLDADAGSAEGSEEF